MAKKLDAEQVERPVAAAERSLRILDAFAAAHHPLTLGDLAEATGLFKSVILRYMISFEKLSYVRKLPDGRYQLSVKAFQLGRAFESSLDQRELIETTMTQLRDSTNESVFFYVREGDNRMCMMGVDSPQSLRVNRKIGMPIPMDTTSICQVLRDYEDGAPQAVENTADLARFSVGVFDPLTASVSAPVFDRNGALIGVIAVSGPIGRFDAQNPEVLDHIASKVHRLSTMLGYGGGA
ncbi:IclR family transcriptional regulator [Pseudohalocynthiibacter aestuariivivens]|uniref:IclR family transcriptional regulator n=1 Tax=Roseovarius pelagicus TaxID=2980108 RepID=A0ABY6DEV1_9RHOB|nr:MULTISPECIES: IclR family transcriptional regulator [Rhodobacterales]QIE46852.1 IclR family transcriptional regulator [Pseudohalocynthiibacter aestuariivivens]UXX84604.1 IclR family transcriptional regulator [Roseovarius pelagicus]